MWLKLDNEQINAPKLTDGDKEIGNNRAITFIITRLWILGK